MVELRIERENRIVRLYFIQGICVEKRDRIWIADVLLKEVRLRDNTKAVGIKLCARTIESMKKLIIDLAQLYRCHWSCTAWSLCIIEDITSCTWNKKCHYKSYRRIHWCRGIIWSNFYDRYGFR